MSVAQRNSGRKETPELRLLQLAEPQFGAFSLAQAREAGWTSDHLSRRVKTGQLQRMLPRIYRFSAARPGYYQSLMAAQLWIGGDGVLSGYSAATIWGIFNEPLNVVQLAASRHVASPVNWVWPSFVTKWNLGDIVHFGRFRVTSVARTLVDIAKSATGEQLEVILDRAIRRKLITPIRLVNYLERNSTPGWWGSAALKTTLARRNNSAPVPMSDFETLLARLLRQAGLPLPVSQFPVTRPDGKSAFIDFAYPGAGLAIEADGYEVHSGYMAWCGDRARRNDLERLGWRVIQISYYDMKTRPAYVVALVRDLLQPRLFA